MAKAVPSLLDNLDLVAVFVGGLFSGSTFFITTVETPALAEVGVDENWRYCSPMYKRAFVSQSINTGVVSIASIIHGSRILNSKFDRNLWIFSGLAIASLIPYSLILQGPTNKIIIDDVDRMKTGQKSQFDKETRKELLHKWSWLHSGRTVVGFIAFGAIVYGLSRRSSLVLKT